MTGRSLSVLHIITRPRVIMLGIAAAGTGSDGVTMFFSIMSVRRLIVPCMFMTAAAGVILAAILAVLLIPVCTLPCADTQAFLKAGDWDDGTNVNERGRDDGWGLSA